MPTYTCPECRLQTDTLAPSGVCFDCTEKTEATRLVEADVPTLTREQPETITHGTTAGEWAGVLPEGGYRYDEKPLGAGGMGVVWRAVRVSTGETFAVKKLRPESFTPTGIRRFVAEAHSLAAVKHDHVVRLYDFVPDPTDPFLVLEFVPGVSLADHLREVGPLHPVRAARMIAEAARGVQAAHDAGVIHRDLKPGTLLLTLDWRMKVADFGLCKTLAEADVPVMAGAVGSGGEGNTPMASGTLTATGRLAGGTPGFMAPEQVSEEYGEVTAATDVFGLGACLHAALTAQAPFPTGKANMGRVLTDAHVLPHEVTPGVPADLSAIVDKCLQKDPCLRYPSAAAVAADLASYLAGDGTSVRPHSRPVRALRQVRKAPRAVLIATAVAVLAVAVGITLAMVPKLLKETPESIQEGYRRDLRARKTVTLIGGTGLPRHHRTRFGTPTLGVTADGTCMFETVGRAMVELLDDPGIDGYTVRAEIRQVESRAEIGGAIPAGEGEVGLYVGYALTPDGVGGEFTTLLALGFADRDPVLNRNGEVDPQKVKASAVVYFSGPNLRPADAPVEVASRRFMPAVNRPGEWRTVEFHVTAGGFTPRWSPDGTEPTPLNGPLVKPASVEYALTQPLLDMAFPRRGLKVPNWTPRAPLGLFAHSSALAVKNVVITPDP